MKKVVQDLTSGGIDKELHQRMEEHKNLKKLMQKNSGKSNLEIKKVALSREMEQVSGNIVRLESQKRSGYEQYVLGKLSKEKFLELKQGLENEIVEQKQEKSTKEKEFALIQEELQQKKQTVGSTEVRLTADNLQQHLPVAGRSLHLRQRWVRQWNANRKRCTWTGSSH